MIKRIISRLRIRCKIAALHVEAFAVRKLWNADDGYMEREDMLEDIERDQNDLRYLLLPSAYRRATGDDMLTSARNSIPADLED